MGAINGWLIETRQLYRLLKDISQKLKPKPVPAAGLEGSRKKKKFFLKRGRAQKKYFGIHKLVTTTVKDNPIARFSFLSNHQTDLSGLFLHFQSNITSNLVFKKFIR